MMNFGDAQPTDFLVPGANPEAFEDPGNASPEPDHQLPFRKRKKDVFHSDFHSRTIATPQPDTQKFHGRPLMTPQFDRLRTERLEGFESEQPSSQEALPVSLAWSPTEVSKTPIVFLTTEELLRPVQSDKMLRSGIRLERGVFTTKYVLSIDNLPILFAKKRLGRSPASYLISLSSDFRQVVGKLKSNFAGCEYLLYAPKKATGGRRQDLAIMQYSKGNEPSGYLKLRVCVPDVLMLQTPFMNLLEYYKAGREEGLKVYMSQPPQYDTGNLQIVRRLYSFDRFSASHIKWSFHNFQLFTLPLSAHPALQLVKTSPCDYLIEVNWPFSPLQALGIALSSIDDKILCD